MFTSFNGTIVFALAYTSTRLYLRVIFTYFADIEDHAQIKQSEPSHCADDIQQPSHRALVLQVLITPFYYYYWYLD